MSVEPDHVLDEYKSLTIKTPEGIIMISTHVGTGVAVYDAEGEEPVGLVYLRREKREDPPE